MLEMEDEAPFSSKLSFTPAMEAAAFEKLEELSISDDTAKDSVDDRIMMLRPRPSPVGVQLMR